MSEHPEFPTEKMAHMLDVSRSGFYKFQKAISSGAKAIRIEQKAEFHASVRTEFEESKKRSGSPKIFNALAEKGILCSKKRVAASMRKQGLKSIYRRKYRPCTTDSRHALPVAPNLLNREFNPCERNRVWVTDITYIPTKEGWIYLTVVIDLFSRMVVGWSLENHMETSMVLLALRRALWTRKPERGLMVHSDQGSQFASALFVTALKETGCVQSMSRKGNCWDNAVAESFFGCFKSECVRNQVYENFDVARSEIFEYIEVFYNRKRTHSTNGYVTPVQFELQKSKSIA